MCYNLYNQSVLVLVLVLMIIDLSAKTSLMLRMHKAGFRIEGHIFMSPEMKKHLRQSQTVSSLSHLTMIILVGYTVLKLR